MLASDDANPNFAGARDPDATLSVRFYNKAVQNNFKTGRESRPIFEDVVYVHIETPGNDKNIIDTPARDHHKERFPRQWAHYMNTHGTEMTEIGTPLEAWPLITAAQAEELKALKFRTVEHIANASDLNISAIGMIGGMAATSFRARAQAFLEAAKDTALAQIQAEELARMKEEQRVKDDAHAAELTALRMRQEEMQKMIEELAANQKKTPGPKPKQAETA